MKKIFLCIFSIIALCCCDNGDLAPQSVEGKTITISFREAECRINTDKEYNTIDIKTAPWETRETETSLCFQVFTFQTHTKSVRKYLLNRRYIKRYIETGEVCIITADYTKLSHNTAKIEMEVDDGTDGEYYTFILTFIAPNYGTVTWELNYGDYEGEGRNAVFYME